MFAMELLYKFCQELLEATGALPPKSLPPSTLGEVVHSERKVRFAADMTETSDSTSPVEQLISSHATKLSWDDACQFLWYTESELHTFKSTARQLLLHKDQINVDDLRGLERYNYERSRYKQGILQSILQAYHASRAHYSFKINAFGGDTNNDGVDDTETAQQEELRRICCEYTKWARRIAYYQGRRDEYMVRRWQQEEKEQKLLKMSIRSSGSWRTRQAGRRASSKSKAANGIIRKLGNNKRKREPSTVAANTSVQNSTTTLGVGTF